MPWQRGLTLPKAVAVQPQLSASAHVLWSVGWLGGDPTRALQSGAWRAKPHQGLCSPPRGHVAYAAATESGAHSTSGLHGQHLR